MDDFMRALGSRSWYAAAAIGLTIAITLWRRCSPAFDRWIPPRWQWLPAMCVAAGAGFVEAYEQGLPWPLAALHVVEVAVMMGAGAIGVHRVAKELRR